ncbi:MAG: nucleoside recognition domain-containing protein [Bacilli bacterium]|jgi:spore maturation protein A|nr:nucleoside recognition domain-containing protein [Bacilli bacterium]
MINKIWAFFIIIGILYGFLTGNIDLINKEIINSAKTALDMFLTIFPIIVLWVGIMAIAKESGLLDKLAKMLSPLLTFLFPEIPKNHESFGFISSNIIVNIFGLGSAATPFGLKAMKSLQELNQKKDTASRSMITFLVMNTSGLSIVPTTVISLRMLHGSSNPTEVILPIILATTAATVFGLIMDRIVAKIKR